MDTIKQELLSLAKQYKKARKEYFAYSDKIKDSFHLTDEQKRSVDFGIIKTNDPDLQKFVDILNNDKNLEKLNKEFSGIKIDGITKILKYLLESDKSISGYDLNNLLNDPLIHKDEIIALFEGLAGVQHIHLVDEKVMLEVPAREYIDNNHMALKYIDYWFKTVFGRSYEKIAL